MSWHAGSSTGDERLDSVAASKRRRQVGCGGRMTQQQIVGLALVAIAAADTAVGHLLIAPRVANEQKRLILRVAFVVSGLCIGALGLAVYKEILILG
jgi:hypothetical protein